MTHINSPILPFAYLCAIFHHRVSNTYEMIHQESLKKRLAKLAAPIFIETLLIMMLGAVDTIMLSRHSDSSVAAVGVVNQIIMLTFLVFEVINLGTSVLCSQYLGARLQKKVVQVVGVSILVNIVVGVSVSLLLFFGAGPILRLMGLTSELMTDGMDYMRIVGAFAFFQAISLTLSASLRHAEEEVRVRGIRCALAGAAGKDRTEAAAALADAKQKLTALLAQSGRPADALEPRFVCPKCQDTGSVNGRTCECVHKVMQQLRRKEIEALSSLSIASFDTMELRYYPNRSDEKVGGAIRPYMADMLADLRSYAEEFDHHSESLMLFGNAGLGKTHAALAIAGIVLEKGYDVIYVSSPDFFSKLEGLHFGADPAGEEETLMQTAAGADLLILDDLGSEFNSAFLISSLYSLLNNRLGAKLPTIVTTNITDGALLEKLYTEKISSRLSAFVPCLFAGDDIRTQKAAE